MADEQLNAPIDDDLGIVLDNDFDDDDEMSDNDIVDAVLELDQQGLEELAASNDEDALLELFGVVLLDEDEDDPEYTDKADLERQFVAGVLEFQQEIREMELALLPEDNSRELDLAVAGLTLNDADQTPVRAAAMSVVTGFFTEQGLETEDVSAQGLGYQIKVIADDGDELHVVVKASAGSKPEFILTANEYNAAHRDEAWSLILVLDALGEAQLVEVPLEPIDEVKEELGWKVRLDELADLEEHDHEDDE